MVIISTRPLTNRDYFQTIAMTIELLTVTSPFNVNYPPKSTVQCSTNKQLILSARLKHSRFLEWQIGAFSLSRKRKVTKASTATTSAHYGANSRLGTTQKYIYIFIVYDYPTETAIHGNSYDDSCFVDQIPS